MILNFEINLKKDYKWLKICDIDLRFSIDPPRTKFENLKEIKAKFSKNKIITMILAINNKIVKYFRWITILGLFFFILMISYFAIDRFVCYFTLPIDQFLDKFAVDSNSSSSISPQGNAIYLVIAFLGLAIINLYVCVSLIVRIIKYQEPNYFQIFFSDEENIEEYCRKSENKWILKKIPKSWSVENLFDYLSEHIQRHYFSLMVIVYIVVIFLVISLFREPNIDESYSSSTFLIIIITLFGIFILLWYKLVKPFIRLKILKQELIELHKSEKERIKAEITNFYDKNEYEKLNQLQTQNIIIKESIEELESIKIISISNFSWFVSLFSIGMALVSLIQPFVSSLI